MQRAPTRALSQRDVRFSYLGPLFGVYVVMYRLPPGEMRFDAVLARRTRGRAILHVPAPFGDPGGWWGKRKGCKVHQSIEKVRRPCRRQTPNARQQTGREKTEKKVWDQSPWHGQPV
jgi:hypothetical protein